MTNELGETVVGCEIPGECVSFLLFVLLGTRTLGYFLPLVDLGHLVVEKLVPSFADRQDLLAIDTPACTEISVDGCWQSGATCP